MDVQCSGLAQLPRWDADELVPRPIDLAGGGGLNTAPPARAGRRVELRCALGDDDAGAKLQSLAANAGAPSCRSRRRRARRRACASCWTVRTERRDAPRGVAVADYPTDTSARASRRAQDRPHRRLLQHAGRARASRRIVPSRARAARALEPAMGRRRALGRRCSSGRRRHRGRAGCSRTARISLVRWRRARRTRGSFCKPTARAASSPLTVRRGQLPRRAITRMRFRTRQP